MDLIFENWAMIKIFGIIFYRNKKEGCLYHKSEKQKDEFFRSLAKFMGTDPDFYWEQYFDLMPYERRLFLKWLEKNKHTINT